MGYSFNPKTGLYTLTPTLIDGGLNLWDDATHLTHWAETLAGSSTINREATEKIEGDYSLRLDVDADNNAPYVSQALIPLTPQKRYRIIIWYKMSVAGKTGRVILNDSSIDVFLKADGTWSDIAYGNPIPNSTVWALYTIDFSPHPSYTTYSIGLKSTDATSSSIYYDKLALEEEIVGDGKTLMVSSVMFIPTNADGDRLILMDYNGKKFVDIKGLINEPNIIPFPKPRKLNGLRISTIDSGKAYVYLAQ